MAQTDDQPQHAEISGLSVKEQPEAAAVQHLGTAASTNDLQEVAEAEEVAEPAASTSASELVQARFPAADSAEPSSVTDESSSALAPEDSFTADTNGDASHASPARVSAAFGGAQENPSTTWHNPVFGDVPPSPEQPGPVSRRCVIVLHLVLLDRF